MLCESSPTAHTRNFSLHSCITIDICTWLVSWYSSTRIKSKRSAYLRLTSSWSLNSWKVSTSRSSKSMAFACLHRCTYSLYTSPIFSMLLRLFCIKMSASASYASALIRLFFAFEILACTAAGL